MASNPRKSSDTGAKSRSSEKYSKDSSASAVPSAPPSRRSSLEPVPQTAPNTLAERDLRLGRATWNKYVLPVQDFSSVIFKELFQTYPDYETFFMHLVDSNNRDVFNSPRFKTHMTTRVMTKLKDMMDALDRPDELKEMMTKLGIYHAKLGVTRRHLENMQRSIVNAVRVSMNKQMQYDEEEAMNKCLGYAFHIAIVAGEEWLEGQRQTVATQQAQLAEKASRTLRPTTSKKNMIK